MLKTTLNTLLGQYEKSKKLSTKIKQKIISKNSSLEQKLKAYLDADDKLSDLSDAKLIRIIQKHRLNKTEKHLAHAILQDIFGNDYLLAEKFIGATRVSNREINFIKQLLKHRVLQTYLDAMSHLNLPPDKSELLRLPLNRYEDNIKTLFENVIYFYNFIKHHAIFSLHLHLHDFINALYILELQMLTPRNARRFLMRIVRDELKSKIEIKADFFLNSAQHILYLKDCNIRIEDFLSFKHHGLSRVFIYVIKLITPYLLDLSAEVIAHIKQQDLSKYYHALYLLQENNLSPAIIQAIFYYPAAINDLHASLKKLKERALFQPSIITLVIAAQPEHPNFIADLLSGINANIIYKNKDLLPYINEFF